MASQNATIAIRFLLRAQLRKKGYSRANTQWMLDAAEPDVIDAAIVDAGVADALAAAEAAATPTPPANTAPAPGTPGVFQQIITALITFLESPAGQSLIAALIQMLIGALGHVTCLCHVAPELLAAARANHDRNRRCAA